MTSKIGLSASEAFRSAFRVAPEIADEVRADQPLGIYGWETPVMEGFKFPETEDLVIALHLGGSRQVRAVTAQGLSRTYSAPGLVTILPPGQPAAFRTEGSIRVMTIHVPRPANVDGPFARVAQDYVPRFAFRDDYVSTSMETLLQAARSGRPVHRDYISKLADALLCHLSQYSLLPLPKNTPELLGTDRMLGTMPLSEMLEYVDAHLNGKLTLDELASQAGVSRACFTRSFKSAMGMSAHQYLTQRRVEAAKRMLSETDFDLAYIAQEAGFCSQSHFTELFRSFAGCTPRRFRDHQ